jgi:hypothetical protein
MKIKTIESKTTHNATVVELMDWRLRDFILLIALDTEIIDPSFSPEFDTDL